MSSNHFKGKYEIELKYQVQSAADFKHFLHSIEHQIRFEDNVETDSYYDTPSYNLHAQNKRLIVRNIIPENIAMMIVKGPGSDHCEATNVNDYNAAKSMLTTLGYSEYLTLQKMRSMYYAGPYHITLDHLEDIGHFAEFAIVTNDKSTRSTHLATLKTLAKQFGLNDEDIEPLSYRELATARLVER